MLVGIDPSIKTVGFAVLDDSGLRTCTFRLQGESLVERLESLRLKFRIHLGNSKPDVIVCEFPSYQDSERGRIAAVSGDTLGLAAVCGFVAYHFRGCKMILFPTPREWKGTVKKHVTARRFGKWTGVPEERYPLDHETDAAMMIRWAMPRVAVLLSPSLIGKIQGVTWRSA